MLPSLLSVFLSYLLLSPSHPLAGTQEHQLLYVQQVREPREPKRSAAGWRHFLDPVRAHSAVSHKSFLSLPSWAMKSPCQHMPGTFFGASPALVTPRSWESISDQGHLPAQDGTQSCVGGKDTTPTPIDIFAAQTDWQVPFFPQWHQAPLLVIMCF